jgi:hypothetical protein
VLVLTNVSISARRGPTRSGRWLPRLATRRCTPSSVYSAIASIGIATGGVIMIWKSGHSINPREATGSPRETVCHAIDLNGSWPALCYFSGDLSRVGAS